MSYNILSLRKWRLVVTALFAFAVQFAAASNVPRVAGPNVTGSYEVRQDTPLGSQAQIRMRIHLVNHGSSDLSIERMTLRDFSHPAPGGTHACAVTLAAHASVDTTQKFIIPRSEYRLWQRGLRPRFILQIAGPGNTRTKAVVRLDRISGQEAK